MRLRRTFAAALLAAGTVLVAPAQAQPPAPGAEVRPIRGPWKPDRPLAKAYDEAARALAMADDNPLIRWAYRVWCQTGYRHPGEEGTGQVVDKLPDPTRDLISPKGFFYSALAGRAMPPGGVRFLDNAWFFGADGLGAVIVRSPDGLLLFDTLTSPEEFERYVLREMPAAGLDPKDITYVFLGHFHNDHTGGANLIRRLGPNARFVMGAPDARIIDVARADLLNGREPERSASFARGPRPTTPEGLAALRDKRLQALPDLVDIRVEAEPGQKTGSLPIRIGAHTEVVAVLDPGHTPGQISVIVPVEHQGKTHRLLVFSGNDQPSEAAQYAVSTDYLRAVAAAQGADVFINTHPYQSAIFYHLRRLKDDPAAPNPLIMGTAGVDRYLGVFADCQRAVRERLADGTWQAW
jgi:glyoxylase-like metal-dependent hydrolase (beta-lactamase superfamily II)